MRELWLKKANEHAVTMMTMETDKSLDERKRLISNNRFEK